MALAPGAVSKGLAALFCGAVVPLGFAPFGWNLIPVIALAALAALLFSAGRQRSAWLGWLFGFGQFAAGVYWVHLSIHHYGNAGLALSLASMLLLVAYMALFPALMGWLIVRVAPTRGWFMSAAFPAGWASTEWLRSWLFSGFPWLNLGYSQIDSPLLGYAAIIGVYGVGFITAFGAGMLALLVTGSSKARLGSTVCVLLVWSGGWGLNQVEWTEVAGAPLTATLVQGNVPQELKWKPEQQQETLERYVALTEQHGDSDLVVWPETAVPAFYDQVEADFLVPFGKKMRAAGVSLITGVPVLDRSRWNYYNAIVSLDHPGTFYYKVHLVPFGEYLPLRAFLEKVLSFLPVPQADFTAGDLGQPLLQAAGYPVGTSICYEIAFGEELIQTLPEAALLINVSNDAWFGDSLAPHQHQEMARMRARESERYVLRATNTGISAIIAHTGRIAERSEQFTTATVTGPVTPRSGATPYVRWGNWPVVTVSVLLLIWLFGVQRRARRPVTG